MITPRCRKCGSEDIDIDPVKGFKCQECGAKYTPPKPKTVAKPKPKVLPAFCPCCRAYVVGKFNSYVNTSSGETCCIKCDWPLGIA